MIYKELPLYKIYKGVSLKIGEVCSVCTDFSNNCINNSEVA